MKISIARRFSPILLVSAVLVLGCVQVYAQAGAPPGAPGSAPAGAPDSAPPGAPGSAPPGAPGGAPAPTGAPAPKKPPAVVKVGDKEVLMNTNMNIGIGNSIGATTGSGNFMVGYFISSKWEAGMGLFFTITAYVEEAPDNTSGRPYHRKNTSGVVGPLIFGRYNWHTGDKSLTYVGLELGLQAYRTNVGNGTNDWLGRPHVGYKYFIKKSVAFDANMGYNAIFSNAQNSVHRSDSLDFKIGLAFIF